VIDEEEKQLVVSGITSEEEVAVTVEDISESADALNSEEDITPDVEDDKDNNEIV